MKILSATLMLLMMAATTLPGPKPVTLSLYTDILGNPDDTTYHCFYAHAQSVYDHDIACAESASVHYMRYAIGTVNGQKHTYVIRFDSESLPSLLLHPAAGQPQPPVNNVYSARLSSKRIQFLTQKNGKMVKVTAAIEQDNVQQ